MAAALAGALALTLISQPAAHSRRTDPVTLPPPEPVRIASFNTAAFLSTQKALADVQLIASHGADIIALQEMGSYQRRLAVRAALVDCETCPYDMYAGPGGAGPASTPILYRSDRFRLLATGSVKVTDATNVGARGAGPSVIHPKYVNWVKLQDVLTRRQVFVLNNHAVASVQAPSGGPNRLTARLRLYRQHMRGLTQLITELRATGGTLFVTGDFNVNFRKDRVVQTPIFPYAGLHRVSVRASYELLGEPSTGTHVLSSGYALRLIDYVSVLDHPAVVPISQEVILGANSDHRPLLVELGLKYKRKFFRVTSTRP